MHSTLAFPLQVAADRTPDADAIAHPDGKLSFAELDGLVGRTAGSLAGQGMVPGSYFPLVAPNAWQTIVMILAVIRAGGVACPLSTRLPPALAAQQVALLDKRSALSEKEADEMIRVAASGAELEVAYTENRPATVIFTSGTSGAAKAAVHSFRNHLASAEASNRHNGLDAGDRWLLSIPLYHVGGLAILFRCMLAGATVVVGKRDVAADLANLGIDHLSLVPTQLKRLLESTRDPSGMRRLKSILLGGAPIPPALVAAAGARGLLVRPTYGMTETSSQVATVEPGGRWPGSGAAILPCNEVQVLGDGQIQVRGDNVFLGYLEAGTVQPAVDADGWFSTGDLGEIDPEGCLKIHGRKDNLIISGGENIYPEEIEAVLMGLDEVEQVRVAAIKDVEFGERPVAYVQTRSGELDRPALVAALERVLPRFKIPVVFHDWGATD